MKMTTAALISMLALGSAASFAQNAAASSTAQPASTENKAAATEKFQVNRAAAITSSVLRTTYTSRALQNAALDGRNPLEVITTR